MVRGKAGAEQVRGRKRVVVLVLFHSILVRRNMLEERPGGAAWNAGTVQNARCAGVCGAKEI